MELFINLLGNLVLTFSSFFITSVGILFSIFQEGFFILSDQYRNETEQIKKSITQQLNVKTSNEIDSKKIKSNLNKLKKIQINSKIKQILINPKYQILFLTTTLLFSFSFVEISALIDKNLKTNLYFALIPTVNIMIFVSIIFFILSLYIYWKSLNIIIDIKKICDEKRNKELSDMKQTVISKLDKIRKDKQPFLKNIFVTFKGKMIKNDDNFIEMSLGEKESIEVSVYNQEKTIAKTVQVGIAVPKSFSIEPDRQNYSITQNIDIQIIRYSIEYIHNNTNKFFLPLKMTALSVGDFKATAFIKGENIEASSKKFLIRVK